jgi:hypothetical protein
MKKLLILLPLLILYSCDKPSSIQIQNNLSKAVIRNVEWGGIPISSQLMPGEKSSEINIYDKDYYNIDLPASYVIKFYLDVNGDKVYLETKTKYTLEIEQHLLIEIDDTTQVINPILGTDYILPPTRTIK